jgi:uncharacterized protein (DUF1697 family)
MAAYVALVRGLGGQYTIAMKDLARIFERLDLKDVRTYIASGNVVFRSARGNLAATAAKITAGIKRARGFAPPVLILSDRELDRAIAANPFPQAEAAPTSLHLVFLAAKPRAPDFAPLDRLLKANERYVLKGKVFYFYAPDGVGKSRAFPRVERTVGLGTARNWRTARTLQAMLAQA